jgi:hypothetical protein
MLSTTSGVMSTRREGLAAVHDPMTDSADFFHRLQDAVLGIDQDPQHPLEGGAVLEDLLVVLVGLAVRNLEHQTRVRQPDLFDHADGQGQILVGVHSLEVGLDDLELDRRRSTVEDENFHGVLRRIF